MVKGSRNFVYLIFFIIIIIVYFSVFYVFDISHYGYNYMDVVKNLTLVGVNKNINIRSGLTHVYYISDFNIIHNDPIVRARLNYVSTNKAQVKNSNITYLKIFYNVSLTLFGQQMIKFPLVIVLSFEDLNITKIQKHFVNYSINIYRYNNGSSEIYVNNKFFKRISIDPLILSVDKTNSYVYRINKFSLLKMANLLVNYFILIDKNTKHNSNIGCILILPKNLLLKVYTYNEFFQNNFDIFYYNLTYNVRSNKGVNIQNIRLYIRLIYSFQNGYKRFLKIENAYPLEGILNHIFLISEQYYNNIYALFNMKLNGLGNMFLIFGLMIYFVLIGEYILYLNRIGVYQTVESDIDRKMILNRGYPLSIPLIEIISGIIIGGFGILLSAYINTFIQYKILYNLLFSFVLTGIMFLEVLLILFCMDTRMFDRIKIYFKQINYNQVNISKIETIKNFLYDFIEYNGIFFVLIMCILLLIIITEWSNFFSTTNIPIDYSYFVFSELLWFGYICFIIVSIIMIFIDFITPFVIFKNKKSEK